MELGYPLSPRLAIVIRNLIPIHEQDLARMVVGIDLEWDDAKGLEGRGQNDWHIVGGHHGGACHVGPRTHPQVRDPSQATFPDWSNKENSGILLPTFKGITELLITINVSLFVDLVRIYCFRIITKFLIAIQFNSQ